MTLIENINEGNLDVLKYKKISGAYKLVFGDEDIEVKVIEGEGDFHLMSTNEFKELLDSYGLTKSLLSSYDNRVFRLESQYGVYSIISDFNESGEPQKVIQFNLSPEVVTRRDFSSSIGAFLSAYLQYLSYFKYIRKQKGFKVLLEDNSNDSEWFFSKIGEYHEEFIPKDDEFSNWYRIYFCQPLNNHSIDLSFKKYGVEAICSYGAVDLFQNLGTQALIELELEDKSVVYLDLSDGTDIENGIVVKDRNISSQKLIKNIRVYYENNQPS